MRKFPFAPTVLAALVVAVTSGTALAEPVVRPPPGKVNSLVSGAYFLLLAPKKLGGQDIRTVRPGILPVTVKTDGKSIVIGGPSVQMTGTIRDGSVSLTHNTGVSLTLAGSTFNGYAASGTFRGGAPGNFEGTFALATVSPGGFKFLTGGAGAGINVGKPGGGPSLSNYAPSGLGTWGYEGPGLNMGTGSGNSNSAFAQPGFGYAADGKDGKEGKDGKKSWTSGLDITGGTAGSSSGSTSSDTGTKKEAKSNFDNGTGSTAQPAPKLSTNDGGWADAIKCEIVACSPAPGTPGSDTGTAPIKPKFDAGDWEPAGGDTAPGKPNTGNGQEQGAGNAAAGSALHRPGTGGDPSDFFKPQGGDILNGNHLFNGASDPPRVGGNFIR